MEQPQIDLKAKLLHSFDEYEQSLNGERTSLLHKIRRNAIDEFARSGFPTKKHEDWRNNDLSFLFGTDYKLSEQLIDTGITEDDVNALKLNSMSANYLVFVNGFYSERLSSIVSKQKSVFIGSINSAMRKFPDTIAEYFSKANGNGNPFYHLNTALYSDGACVIVPEGKTLQSPVVVINYSDSSISPIMSNPRHLFIVGECSKLQIIEFNVQKGANAALTNAVTEIFASPFTNIDYYKLHDSTSLDNYIGTTNISQQRASVVRTGSFALDGAYVRNNLTVNIEDELCDTNLYGLYLIEGNVFIDNHTLINHKKANSTSNEMYKGILNGTATAVFSGKIIVSPDAQKTSAYQTNRNILLSDEAQVYAKPQLEIYADDVKCSHGATSGYLDEEQLYYFRTRGIGENKAKSLLLNAFASEVVEKIGIAELRDLIKRKTAEKLKIEDIYFCDILDAQF